MDLEVIGRHALLFDDDALAAFVNSPEALVDWNSLSIDRYDVRHLLSSPPPPRNRHHRRNQHRSPSHNLDDSLESDLDHERYLDLPSTSDDEQDLETEAEAKNAGGYNAVAFSYGAPSELSEEKNIDAKSSFRPPFTVPEHLLQNLPPTAKVHQIIARTAMFVSKHGAQSEIVLRVKQGDNPTFGFLLPDHNLHPYFRFLVDHQELVKSDVDGKSIEEVNRTDGGLDQMDVGGALSLLGSVYGSGEDEEGATEDALALKTDSFEQVDNADSITSHGLEQNNSSLNAAGKDEALSNPPLPSLKERSHVIKRNHAIIAVKSGTTNGIKKDGDVGSVSAMVNKLQPSIVPSLSKFEPSVLEPPSDLKRVVDKIVEFILRNGKEFEAVLIQQDTKHGRFPFLLPSNQYHPYYLKALQKAKESKCAGKKEKHDSMGHGTEKKTGNKESDSMSLGSDIPCESDRKEKFKMVIGKSKKDEKDPPSKATQPQVGVSVDATAAAAILQAATKGIKNPNLEILWKTLSSAGQGPSSEGGGSLLSSWPQSSNQKPDKNEYKAIAKTAALAAASEADSSEATLTREQKLKAERLRRAKMFAAMIKGGAAPVKSESLRGLSVEPSESGFSGSDSQVVHLVGAEGEGSSAPMEVDTCNKIEKAEKKGLADEQNERRSKRSYRSRSKRGEEEGEEEENLKEDRDNKHSRKKRRSHRSSHHSRDRRKHRKRHSSSQERESQHKHGQDSSSEDEHRHSRHRHKHDSSSDDEQRHSRHKHRHDNSSDDELRHPRRRHRRNSPRDDHRHTERRHKHNGSSDDERMHSRRGCRRDSSDDEYQRSQHQRNHGTSSDNEDQYQAKSVKHRKISRLDREAELEEGEILTKSDQSKVSDGEEGASREPSVDLSKSSQRSETAEVSNELRAKIRAMLMATL
ncbi:splicing factor, suppressor of white-apricot homolog [Ricinus communis]|uniref:RNA binding protein, putative n=1 Tax=Ricinus communis TaxID=3988 RepID=B9STX5_RICCO|nr:splicing factor, suppressor of white-apricot homolog [Ricinus communis]EEF32910.1 RNA binding protein, putative [Ricinus communis]|eukprot:XP_002529444.1 splicing factor, suppressor of white-apricot homolog [Ricinus communis]